MQERHQILDLFFIQHCVEWRHIAASRQDCVAYMLISGRHSAWESLFSEHPHKRRTLQRFFLERVVADRAARVIDFVSMLFLNSKRTERCR